VPVTILAGVGIDRGLAWGRFRRATAAVALLAMVAMLGWSAWTVRRLAEREAAIRRDVVAMAAHVPPAAPLLSFGVTCGPARDGRRSGFFTRRLPHSRRYSATRP
jgi:hypothetical protein